jgi:hypothetical protein
MLTNAARWSLGRGNAPVPSRWQATVGTNQTDPDRREDGAWSSSSLSAKRRTRYPPKNGERMQERSRACQWTKPIEVLFDGLDKQEQRGSAHPSIARGWVRPLRVYVASRLAASDRSADDVKDHRAT